MALDESKRDEWVREQRERGRLDDTAPLNGSGGGGTSGGMSDDWKATVDAQLKQLHEDFRKVLGWLIAGIVAPLVAIFGLYAYTGNRSDRLADAIAATQVAQARADGNVQVLSQRVADVDKKLDAISAKLEKK